MVEAPSYISLINGFWLKNIEYRFSPIDGFLYFYLLDVCNRLYWKNPFGLSNGQITSALMISEKTLIGARKRLVEAGLITVCPGKSKRESTRYEILGCKNCSSSGSSSGTHHNIKTKTQRKKNVSYREQTLFEEEKGQKRAETFKHPDVVEVMEYARRNGYPEEDARRFYAHYSAQGWVRGNSQKIKNWQSMFNWWMSNEKNGNQQRTSSADNIREAQDYIVREMQQSLFQAEGYQEADYQEVE